MNVAEGKFEVLSAAIRRLRDWPIQRKADLRPWYEAARGVSDMVCETDGVFTDDDFHFLMHWLADADIRLKDAKYAAMQNERLREVLAELGAKD